MQERLAKLDSDIDYIKRDIGDLKTDVREIRSHQERDFRLLFGAILAAGAGLAALMARGFNWIS
jgi:hypothetical protein